MNSSLKKIRFMLMVALGLCFCSAAAYAQTTAGNNMKVTSCNGAIDYTGNPPANQNTYAGLYKNAEGIFFHAQFPELSPGDLMITQNNLPFAPNLTPCDNAPWKDPVLTYAAYVFCQINAPHPRNPLFDVPGLLPNGATTLPKGLMLTGPQLYALEDFEQISSAADLVYGHCKQMIQRRLSYSHTYKIGGNTPTSVVIDPVTGCNQNDMYCQGKALCQVLKSSMNGAANAAAMATSDNNSPPVGPTGINTPNGQPGGPATTGSTGDSSGAIPSSTPNFGHNITNTNNPEYDGILASCDGNDTDTYAGGLSEEAHEAIWAHRCDDPNYGGAHAANHGGGAQGEDAMTECHAEAKAYDDGVKEDIVKLEGEILALKALTANLKSQKVK